MRQTIRKIIHWVRELIKEKFHQDHEHFPYYLSILVSFVIFVLSLNFFVEITEDLKEDELVVFDQYFTEKIQSFRAPPLTSFFQLVTHLGDRFSYLFFTLVIAAYFFIKYAKWKFTLQTLLVLLFSSLSNVVLKRVINRERPTLEHLVAVSTLSYPSGHAMSAMAFYGFLIYLSFRLSLFLWSKVLSLVMLGTLILLIGISRVYLGVHYPSDVLAGFVGGLIWVTFCAILFNIIDLYRKRE